MIYLLALIGLVVVTAVLWRTLGSTDEAPRGRAVGPDDDPEFLRGIDTGTARRHTADDDPDDPEAPTPA
jgi:hypothetical protein